MSKTIADILNEMEGNMNRPADQVGGGDVSMIPPGTPPEMIPPSKESTNKNRPADQAMNGQNGEIQNPNVPMDPLQKWDEFMAMSTAPAGNLKEKVKFAKEDFGTLFEGTGLTDDTIGKLLAVFEATVNTRLAEDGAKLRTVADKFFTEELNRMASEMKADVEQKAEKYATYVAEQWAQKNAVALESGAKVALAENFLEKLRDLFVENNIAVPEGRKDILESMSNKIKALEKKLNESVEDSVQLYEHLKVEKKKAMVAEACAALPLTKQDQFKKLTENVVFEDEKAFASTLSGLLETCSVGKKPEVKTDKKPEVKKLDESVEFPEMAAYLSAAAKSVSVFGRAL